MSHTTTRDAERTTGTPPPLIVCARLKALPHGTTLSAILTTYSKNER